MTKMLSNKIGVSIGIAAAYLGKLLKTGQTTQYSGKEDDGHFETGLAKDYTVLDEGDYAGTKNITLNAKTHALSNNCVQDEVTGLMWIRDAPDADIGPDNNGRLYWLDEVNDEDIFDFKDQANANSLGGHTDWRVPNSFELQFLADKGSLDPAIDAIAFPNCVSYYHWSSTTRSDNVDRAFATSFYTGVESYGEKATSKYYCFLVRLGI